MNNIDKKLRLAEIEEKIKKAEGKKSIAIVLMVISIFCLWPLLIVGIIMYISANNNINELNEEKKNIMLIEYYNENK